MEGGYHATAAASLTIQCGLHGVMAGQTVFEPFGTKSSFALDHSVDYTI